MLCQATYALSGCSGVKRKILSQLKKSHLQSVSLPQNEGPSSLSPTERDGIISCHSDSQRWLRPHQDFSRLHSKASFQLPQLGNRWPLYASTSHAQGRALVRMCIKCEPSAWHN